VYSLTGLYQTLHSRACLLMTTTDSSPGRQRRRKHILYVRGRHSFVVCCYLQPTVMLVPSDCVAMDIQAHTLSRRHQKRVL